MADEDDDIADSLRMVASPLRCIGFQFSRWPSAPCFGSYFSDLRRPNGRRRYPRLGFCFWLTQDHCDECRRPTCYFHGWKVRKPAAAAHRVNRGSLPRFPFYYDFLCVHCAPNEHPMYTSTEHRMNYGGSLAEYRGWNEQFSDVDPITGRRWEHISVNVMALAHDGIIDLTM